MKKSERKRQQTLNSHCMILTIRAETSAGVVYDREFYIDMMLPEEMFLSDPPLILAIKDAAIETAKIIRETRSKAWRN